MDQCFFQSGVLVLMKYPISACNSNTVIGLIILLLVMMQRCYLTLDCSQSSIFSCFSLVIECGERVVSELDPSAKQEVRGGGGGGNGGTVD